VSIVAAPESIGYAEARERVLAAATPLASESVALSLARGRALRQEIRASHDVPPFRNSSMDGIAVRSADTERASAASPLTLRVIGEIAAGAAPARTLSAGECIWIMTGAMLPEGADAVVPVEELKRAASESEVSLPVRATPGLNVRDAGADARTGDVVLSSGRELSAHDLAVLATFGISRPEVGRSPRVVALSTGDELLGLDEPLRPGAIRDSNLPMLAALLEEAGATVAGASRLPDDVEAVASAIAQGLQTADVVITLGGVSAGRHDPVKEALARFDGIARWRVAMKPGRPQAFGAVDRRLFFGLPGNPASVACVFEVLVRPALRQLQGFTTLDRPRLTVRAADRIESRSGRTDFVRVTLERHGEEWWAKEAGAQISGHVLPQSRAHALLVVPEASERIEAEEDAEAMLLRWPEAG
jgi:molybdopterin molybdotransferase